MNHKYHLWRKVFGTKICRWISLSMGCLKWRSRLCKVEVMILIRRWRLIRGMCMSGLIMLSISMMLVQGSCIKLTIIIRWPNAQKNFLVRLILKPIFFLLRNLIKNSITAWKTPPLSCKVLKVTNTLKTTAHSLDMKS